MDRKKIYIAIIVVCFAGTIGILYYNFSGGGSPTPPVPQVVNQTSDTSDAGTPAAAAPDLVNTSKNGDVIYSAPTVFPNDTNFDWAILSDPKFTSQTPIDPLKLDPATDVGRDDPLQPY